GDRLQAGIAGPSASDRERSLAGFLRLEGDSYDGTLTGDSARAAGPRRGDLRLPDCLVLAMHQSDDLSILRKEAAIGNIHELQQLGVIVQLYGHGIDILRARDQQVHSEGISLIRLDGRGIEKEARCSPRIAGR